MFIAMQLEAGFNLIDGRQWEALTSNKYGDGSEQGSVSDTLRYVDERACTYLFN